LRYYLGGSTQIQDKPVDASHCGRRRIVVESAKDISALTALGHKQMQCLECGTDNPTRARFCMECGLRLVPPCWRCGAEVPRDARFCPGCGASLAPEPPVSPLPMPQAEVENSLAAPLVDRKIEKAERRQVTVLFCDLVGSTELTRTLGDTYRKVLSAYRAESEKVVKRFDGHVAQRLGDGLLVSFGYPAAHEDDAQRAVRVGLGMLEAIRRLDSTAQREHHVRLATRIGIATGVVVIDQIGEGFDAELIGETANLASRLQVIAKPGTLVISDSTRRLIEGYFAIRDLGPQELKGLGQLSVYEVLQEGTARSRLDVVGPAGLTPLAGRDLEVQVLWSSWERVKTDNRGKLLLLCGEPGVGKSRLVRSIEEYVAKDSQSWLTPCRASPYHQHSAFYPIVDLLERVVLKLQNDDSLELKSRKLEDWLLQYDPNLGETLPLLKRLLSLQSDDTDIGPVQDPMAERQRTMEGLLSILFMRASKQPVLFVFEDLHWADASTLELLNLLVTKLPSERVLAVLTFRPEFRPPWLDRDWVTYMTVDRLGRAPSEQIVRSVLGEAPISPEMMDEVLIRTDGNPLFIEEVAKTVRESTQVRNVGGQRDSVLPRLAIPATLRDSLTARVDRLPEAKKVAPLCAALGREFSYELARAVSMFDESALRSALHQLVGAELLYLSGAPPHPTYVFKHALIQEIAYDMMLQETREDLHGRIAEVLERQFAGITAKQPELVAHHFTESARPERAIAYWQMAGLRALERAANVEAIAHLERALRLVLELTPNGPAREEQELHIQHALAPAYMAIRGWASPEVERACRRALELCAPGGDFGSLWGLWTNYFLRGKLGEALQAGTQVLELAQRARAAANQETSKTVNLEVMARHAIGYSHFYRGEFRDARTHAEAGLRLQVVEPERAFNLEAEGEIVRQFQFSSSAALRMMLGSSLWMLGYPKQARALVESAVVLTRELRHIPSEAYALAASLLVHHYELDIDSTSATADRLLDIAGKEHFEIWSPFALMFRGWVRTEQGLEEGIEETRAGLRQWEATGSYLNRSIIVAMLARSLIKAARKTEALVELDDEISQARERQELHFAPELYRLRAVILMELGKFDEAQESLDSAIDMAREQGARLLELRAVVSSVPAWVRTGRLVLARHRLRDLYVTFTEGFDSRDLAVAHELLSQLDTAAITGQPLGLSIR